MELEAHREFQSDLEQYKRCRGDPIQQVLSSYAVTHIQNISKQIETHFYKCQPIEVYSREPTGSLIDFYAQHYTVSSARGEDKSHTVKDKHMDTNGYECVPDVDRDME